MDPTENQTESKIDGMKKVFRDIGIILVVIMFIVGKCLQFFYLMNSLQILFNPVYFIVFKEGKIISESEYPKEKGKLMWNIVQKWVKNITFFISGQMQIMLDYMNSESYQFQKTAWIEDEIRNDPKLVAHNLSSLQRKIIQEGIKCIPDRYQKDFIDLPKKIFVEPTYYLFDKISNLTMGDQNTYINGLEQLPKNAQNLMK